MGWQFTEGLHPGGQFRLIMRKLTRGGAPVPVTQVRGAMTQLQSFGSADPFGDASAVFVFPAITHLDDLKAPDLSRWLDHYADVDLWWIPSIVPGSDYGDWLERDPRINPLTGAADIIAPGEIWVGGQRTKRWNKIKVWEGFVASIEFGDETGQLTLQCQGSNFQLDRYLQKPFYPARPWPLEKLIADAFSHKTKPHLRTKPLRIDFPTSWTKKAPKYSGANANVYAPVVKPGTNWTGLTSRQTGSWERALTGFVQNQLTSMITDGKSGVTPGNQWTVQHERASTASPRGRQPVLMIRNRFRTPDFSVQLGAPGVKLSVSADSTQSENVIYGDGTDLNGQVWRNAIVSSDGSRTDYLPLAAARDVYPPNKNSVHDGRFVTEAYTKFGTGFSQEDASDVASQQLARDIEPGWSGTLQLKVDPSATMPRWLIRAGMTVRVKNFLGTGDAGVPFHISQVQAAPMDGSVELTIDTRYRDLLTVAEAQQRTRDPLTPIRMLQVNRTSVMIEDIQAPWDYSAGSGFIPRASKEMYKNKPRNQPFPQADWVRKHPPLHFPSWYVKVKANAPRPNGRWSGRVPILTAERGTINRVEIFCVDSYGRRAKWPFHVSFYYTPVDVTNMPRRGGQSSPYFDGAFESVNPATGQSWPAGNFLAPDDKFIIGWGNKAAGKFQRAGFYPGSERQGGAPTGLFVDEATWTFDNTQNPDYDRLAKPGQRQQTSAITIYAMFYAEAPITLWFGGRLFRQNPGQG